jgi:hypothetical protein
VLQPSSVRVVDVSPDDREVIKGFEAAWWFFGGIFLIAIPDNTNSIVTETENTAPHFNDTFLVYAQARGFVIDAVRVATPTDKACASAHARKSAATYTRAVELSVILRGLSPSLW